MDARHMTATQLPVTTHSGTQLHLDRRDESIVFSYGESRSTVFRIPAGVPALHLATNLLALAEMSTPDAALHFIADSLGVDVEVKPRLPEVQGAVVEWQTSLDDRPVRAVRVADGWLNAKTGHLCYPPPNSRVVFDGGAA